MKKEKFFRFLRDNQCFPTGRQKGSHAQYQNRANGNKTVVPLHNDIAEPRLAPSVSSLASRR